MIKYIKELHKTCAEVSKVLSKEASIPRVISYPFYFVAISINLLFNKLKIRGKKGGHRNNE